MSKDFDFGYCGCWILIMIFNLSLGGWSVNYLLGQFASDTIPFIWATVIGFFLGQITVPIAVIVLILSSFGITF